MSASWDQGRPAAPDCRWPVLPWTHGRHHVPAPAAPPGGGRGERGAGLPRRHPLGRQDARGDRRHRRRLREAALRTWPPSRPPRWPRSRTARSPRQHLAWSSTGDWYTHLAGTHPRTGRRTVRHAKLLVTERTADPGRAARRPGLPRTGRRHRATRSRSCPPTRTCGSWPRRPCSARPGGCTPPTSPRPPATSSTSSTPTAPNARPRGTSTPGPRRPPRPVPGHHRGRRRRRPPPGPRHRRGRRHHQGRPPPADQAGPPAQPADEDCGDVEDVRDHGARMWDAWCRPASTP